MIWAILGIVFVVALVLYVVGKVRAARKFRRGDADPVFGGFFESAGSAMIDFARSDTPEKAVSSGLQGMGKMAKSMAQAQHEMKNKFWLEIVLVVLGKVGMWGSVIVALVVAAIRIFG